MIDEIESRVIEDSGKAKPLPPTWRQRVKALFPEQFPFPFSKPHIEYWDWVNAIDANAPRPFVALWPRGRGKSTNLEASIVYLGGLGVRRYAWYVCETQDQADKHIIAIRDMMESDNVGWYFPEIGKPEVTKTGGRTWRRNLLMCANGFGIEAIGLDKAIRGGKLKTQRPDIIALDDIDGKHDTEAATNKKETTITSSILAAGAINCAVMFVQNLIHNDSIAHRLSKPLGEKGAADYLANRIISGPHKAIEGLKYKYDKGKDGLLQWVITAGKSLWKGFTLAICQQEINRGGPTAFKVESQHDVDSDDPLALLSSDILNATRVSSHPPLARSAVGVDPSGGAGQTGIVGGGVALVNDILHGYTILDYTTPKGTPSSEWAIAVLRACYSLNTRQVFVERNFGGDMVTNTIRTAELKDAKGEVVLSGREVVITETNASRGKAVRAEPVASLFQLGRCHHVGHFAELQHQWVQWVPGTSPSPNNLDAEVWLFTGLGMVQLSEAFF